MLLVQVTAVIIFLLYLNSYFIVFHIASMVIGIIVFFVCVNRTENPEYKIPWIFLILALPHIPDKKMVFCLTRSSYKHLRDAGVKIYEYTPGFIHAKMLISDDDVGFVGTINMDYRSLTHHFECGAVLYKAPCLRDIRDDFENIFTVSQLIDDNFKLSAGAKLINALLAVLRAIF